MTIQRARPYILTFLRIFVLFAIFKFLMDKYAFNQEFQPYKLLFMSTWMAVIMTFFHYRRRKKAEATTTES